MDKNDTGLVFLENLNEAVRLNQWIYDYIEPHLGRSVLEVGCGIGNITEFLLREPTRKVFGVDVEPEYVQHVRQKFAANEGFQALAGDITDPSLVRQLPAGQFDSVVCLNVLEHIEDDALAVRVSHELLSPGGRLILLCPAHKALYGSMDRHLGHFRRYSRAGLAQLVTREGFAVDRAFYFNSFSAPGWFVNGKLLNRRHASPFQIRVVEFIVPLFRLFEDRVKLPFGLSVLMFARKQPIAGP
jgi:SAM-dependent methyltransferase